MCFFELQTIWSSLPLCLQCPLAQAAEQNLLPPDGLTHRVQSGPIDSCADDPKPTRGGAWREVRALQDLSKLNSRHQCSTPGMRCPLSVCIPCLVSTRGASGSIISEVPQHDAGIRRCSCSFSACSVCLEQPHIQQGLSSVYSGLSLLFLSCSMWR